MADWPLDNTEAGLLAPGRQVWKLGDRPRVEVTVGATATALDLSEPRQARAAVLAGAQVGADGRLWPGAFRFAPDDGGRLAPGLASARPWSAPSGGDGGLPQSDAIGALDPASRADLLAPTQALLFVAGAPAALYALRTSLGVLEVFLPEGGTPGAGDWLKLGVVARAGVELAPWSAAVAVSPLGFVAPTAVGPVFVRLPRLPGATGEADVAPAGARSVGGAVVAGDRWLAPVRAGEGLALLARADRWAADWAWVEVEAAPGWPEPTSPAGQLAAAVADGREDVFWVGREGYLAWSPGEARAAWTPWPECFRAIPTARPWLSGDGVLWQQGEEPEGDGARLVFRPLRFGASAAAEARPVRNPHFSAGSWTYASSGRPARWLRPWDRMVDDEQLRAPEGALLAPLLGFVDRNGHPTTLLAEITGEGVHAGALIRGEQPGLVRAALKQHRSLRPVEELGAAFRIGRLDDLQVVRLGDRLLVSHRDEPGDYARAFSWRIVPAT